MFYVIGSENSKSGSASYSSRQQNQRRGGAVRHFSEHRIRVGQTRHLSIWSNSLFSCLCNGEPLCHYYTDNVICRQGCKALSLYSEFQKANLQPMQKKFSLSVKTFLREKSTAQKSVPTWHELFLKKFCPTWAEFSKLYFPTSGREVANSLPTNLVGNSKSYFCPNWSDVKKQLLHKLCRS